MRLMAGVIAIAAAIAVFAASVTEAAPRNKRLVPVQQPAGTIQQPTAGNASTVFTSRDEQGRTRTKIIVQKRSYLDGGTEVMPGTYLPSNAMMLPGQHPSSGLGNNVITNPPGPIPDPWFLPGKNNPWPWFAN
jgi:hypothetical protein